MFGFSKKTDDQIKEVIETERKEQKESQLKWQHYVLSAIFVLAGLTLILYVQIDISFICKFLAAVFAATGVISIVSYCVRDVAETYYRLDLVYGITAGFTALLFYTKQETLGAYFPIIAGFILFANGVVKLQHSIDMKRIDRKMKKVTEMWLVVMIFALMCIAAGIVTAYLKTSEDRTMFLVIGISLVVAGLSDVFVQIVFNKKVRAFRSGDYDTAQDDKTYGYLKPDVIKELENKNEPETIPEAVPEIHVTQEIHDTVADIPAEDETPAHEAPEYEAPSGETAAEAASFDGTDTIEAEENTEEEPGEKPEEADPDPTSSIHFPSWGSK
ncbi:MAG: hypothetical protein IKQ40_02330 [Lachnospiraceae bacterium]|nr:hypothetical protein [Lachnospiraceae bacterium]